MTESGAFCIPEEFIDQDAVRQFISYLNQDESTPARSIEYYQANPADLWRMVHTAFRPAAAIVLMQIALRENRRVPAGMQVQDMMCLADHPSAAFLFLAGCMVAGPLRRKFSAGQMHRILRAAHQAVARSSDPLTVANAAFFFHRWWRSNVTIRTENPPPVLVLPWAELARHNDFRLFVAGNMLTLNTHARPRLRPLAAAAIDEETLFASIIPCAFGSRGGFASSFCRVAICNFFQVMGVPAGRLDAVIRVMLDAITPRELTEEYVVAQGLKLAETLLIRHLVEFTDDQMATLRGLCDTWTGHRGDTFGISERARLTRGLCL